MGFTSCLGEASGFSWASSTWAGWCPASSGVVFFLQRWKVFRFWAAETSGEGFGVTSVGSGKVLTSTGKVSCSSVAAEVMFTPKKQQSKIQPTYQPTTRNPYSIHLHMFTTECMCWSIFFVVGARCLSAGRTWNSRVDQQGFEPPPAVCQRWQDQRHTNWAIGSPSACAGVWGKNVQLQLLLVPRKLLATSMPNVPLPAFSFATSNKSGIVFPNRAVWQTTNKTMSTALTRFETTFYWSALMPTFMKRNACIVTKWMLISCLNKHLDLIGQALKCSQKHCQPCDNLGPLFLQVPLFTWSEVLGRWQLPQSHHNKYVFVVHLDTTWRNAKT